MKSYKTSLPGIHDVEIPAVYCLPADQEKADTKDLIILCHGISTDKNEYLDFLVTMERELCSRGISTIRFDFRGHGESAASPAEFSVSSQILDLYHVVQWANRELRPKRISFFGVSFGAPPCLMIDQWLHGINMGPRFLIAPVLDYRRTFLDPESNWGKETFSKDAIEGALNGKKIYLSDSFYVNGSFFSEVSAINVGIFLNACECPVHVMHGMEDDMVSLKISKDVAHGNSHTYVHEFPNMEHGFTDKGDESGESKETVQNIAKMIDIISRGLNNG